MCVYRILHLGNSAIFCIVPVLTRRITRLPTSHARARKKGKNAVFSIEGVHGVGKTTVLDLLRLKYANDANWLFFNERTRHRDFIIFGSKNLDMAYDSEWHFLQNMVIRNTEISRRFVSNTKKIFVMDRSPLCVLVYSAALGIPSNKFRLLTDMYESVDWNEDYIIYLTADINTVLKRVHQRGSLDVQRQNWNEEDIAYMQKILDKYEEYFRCYDRVKDLIRIDTTLLNPEQTLNAVEQAIRKKLKLTGNESLTPQNTLDKWAAS